MGGGGSESTQANGGCCREGNIPSKGSSKGKPQTSCGRSEIVYDDVQRVGRRIFVANLDDEPKRVDFASWRWCCSPRLPPGDHTTAGRVLPKPARHQSASQYVCGATSHPGGSRWCGLLAQPHIHPDPINPAQDVCVHHQDGQ